MGESLLTALSMDTATAHHPHQGPSTFLSMDTASHDDLDFFLQPHGPFRRCLHAAAAAPPDINVPLAADPSPPPPVLHDANNVDMLDVGLGGPQLYDSDSPAAVGAASASPPPPASTTMVAVSHTRGSGSSAARKCAKRNDSIWGAWFFFTHYFRPVMAADKGGKAKGATASGNGGSATLDAFLVQHDMENMYMWVFKERTENALGKMQLRSFMNGHSRLREPQFPFSADKGFARSHRMQRKHYRGLSNPQCLHGIEIVREPNLAGVPEVDLKRWIELTGRDAGFSIPTEASDFESWRNMLSSDFELERPAAAASVKSNSHGQQKKSLNNSSGLNLFTQPSNHNSGDGLEITARCNKRKKDSSPAALEEDCSNSNSDKAHDMDVSNNFEPSWMNDFSGVMRHASGPVTAAKTIYEDSRGYLIIISLPFADIQRVKVSWRNTVSNGIVKVSCTSVGRMPFLKRHDRTFMLVDPSPEHCPPGEFIREISLPTRIPEDATLEAYCDETCTSLEIIVPKFRIGPEEHEVRVSMRPPSSWCQ